MRHRLAPLGRRTTGDAGHEHVRRLLAGAHDRLERLVETLLAEDTVGEDRLATILGPRPAGEEAVPPKAPTRAAG